MSKSLLALLALTLVAGATAAPADAKVRRDPAKLDFSQAQQDLSKGGPAFKAVITPAGNVGYMFGGQGASYLSETVYLGGAGYGGTFAANGTVSGGLGYGGMLIGKEHKLGEATVLDVNLLVGGGGGGALPGGSAGGGSFVLEPGVSVSQLFGNGYRGTLSLGYLYMPTAEALSGATVGLSLGFKTLTFTFPVND